jgi:SH3-like domain-containing protein
VTGIIHRPRLIALVGIAILMGACNPNSSPGNPTFVVQPAATNTLAPIITQTQRFTATPIPTSTLIPSPTVPTLTPTEPEATEFVPTPTLTPTPQIKGVINLNGGQVNMRSGPGTNFRIMANLKSGSQVIIQASSTDGEWSLIQLDDGTEGWISSSLLTQQDPSATVPALSTLELTERAQLATAMVQTQTAMAPTAEGGVTVDASAPAHSAQVNRVTDILAYCDQRPDAKWSQNRKFTSGQKPFLYWSWIAKTPEQMKDHLNAAQYDVKVNGQAIGDWAKYGSKVIKQSSGDYIVYWFVPLAQLAPGTYKVDFKVTWTEPIFDGTDRYGPGTDKSADTGTCTFTVK